MTVYVLLFKWYQYFRDGMKTITKFFDRLFMENDLYKHFWDETKLGKPVGKQSKMSDNQIGGIMSGGMFGTWDDDNNFRPSNIVTDNIASKSDMASNGASLGHEIECANCHHPKSKHEKLYKTLKDDTQHICMNKEEVEVEEYSLDRAKKIKRLRVRTCGCDLTHREIDLNSGLVVSNKETF